MIDKVLVQLPEPIRNSKYPTIAEIGKERIRRVIKKSIEEKQGKLILETVKDSGFRCIKLLDSNFSDWQLYAERNISQLELRFQKSEIPLVIGWQPANLLIEIMLLQGFPLNSHIRFLPEFSNNQINEVTSEFWQHRLYVCLDTTVKSETVSTIKLRPEDVFICLDSALSDESKIVLADRCNLKVI